MFDTRPALADMASQIRSCRAGDGLTLQQLASRSGVAASTIHKVESQQMVPTVSVLLKIAKGLGRRPDELIRDDFESDGRTPSGTGAGSDPALAGPRRAGVWHVALEGGEALPSLELESTQHAIVMVEAGAIDLQIGPKQVRIGAGDCVEVDGGRDGGAIESLGSQMGPTRLTIIASPPGGFGVRLAAFATESTLDILASPGAASGD